MSVHVVVPVYRELENGNIFRLLKSFADQEAIPSGKPIELVLIVNNSSEAAKQNSGSPQ